MAFPPVIELQSAIPLDSGQSSLHGLVYVAAKGKLYASLRSGYAIRFNNPDDLTDRTVISGLGDNYDIVYVSSVDKVYVPAAINNTVKVYEIDPTNWTYTTPINEAGSGVPHSICSDGTYLYISTAGAAGRVYKYKLSDYSRDNTLDLTSHGFQYGYLHALRYDGSKLYATTLIYPSVVRVDPTTFTYEDSADNSDIATNATDDFCFIGNYLFVGIESFNGTNVMRVTKNSLSTRSLITTGITHECWGTFSDGTYVWAVFDTNPGTVGIIDPDTLAYTLVNMSAGNGSNEIFGDGAGLFYVSFYNDIPSTISQLSGSADCKIKLRDNLNA